MALARAGAVSVLSVGEEETVVRVRVPGRPAPVKSVLYPEDEIWECDCRGKHDPCEHVVAAAFFLHQAEGRRVPAPRRSPSAWCTASSAWTEDSSWSGWWSVRTTPRACWPAASRPC
nr:MULTISPECIES: SWIM zinc finger family protein [Corallococcus]